MYLIAFAEAWDFAQENQLLVGFLALVYLYLGLEASGYGLFSQSPPAKQLNDDLLRDRDLQLGEEKEEMVYASDTSCSSDSTSAQSNHTISTTMEQNEDDLGAASHAYEGIKDAWTWGRHETPFSPVLGWAEGVTSATVGLFGTDLKGIDDGLKPQVADLDEHFVKPTISNVMKILSDLKREDEKAC